MVCDLPRPETSSSPSLLQRMGRLRLRGRTEHLLFVTGINLTLLNFIMVQHATIAFRHMEAAVLVFSLAYFSGISLGYFVSDRISPATIRRTLPAFLVIQMATIILLQPLFYVISRDLGAWAKLHHLSGALGGWAAGALVFVLITLGVTSLHSIFLPMAVETHKKELRRCYTIEIVGSIVGLLCIPVLTVFSHHCLLAGYFLTFLSMSILLGAGRGLTLSLMALTAVFLTSFDSWDKATSSWFYRRRYRADILGVAHTRYTPYHKIEVLDLGDDEYMLMLNGKRQFARGSHYTYSYFVAEYPAKLLGSPSVCILGCGSMSTVGRIGSFVPSIQIVDLDRAVFETSSRFFQRYNRLDQLNNWTFTADDAKHFLANSRKSYGLILHDIPPAKSRQTALTYTAEFFSLVKERLEPDGVFSISSLTPLHSSSRYGKRMLATLTHVFDRYFVILRKTSVYFYGGLEGMPSWEKSFLVDAVEHADRKEVRVFIGGEVDQLVVGADIITINNVGDLIYE